MIVPGQMLIVDLSSSSRVPRIWTRLYVSCHNNRVTVIDCSAGGIDRLSLHLVPLQIAEQFENSWGSYGMRVG